MAYRIPPLPPDRLSIEKIAVALQELKAGEYWEPEEVTIDERFGSQAIEWRRVEGVSLRAAAVIAEAMRAERKDWIKAALNPKPRVCAGALVRYLEMRMRKWEIDEEGQQWIEKRTTKGELLDAMAKVFPDYVEAIPDHKTHRATFWKECGLQDLEQDRP